MPRERYAKNSEMLKSPQRSIVRFLNFIEAGYKSDQVR